MKKFLGILGLLCALVSATLAAEDAKTVKLPEVNKKGGMSLMEALAARKSTRAFDKNAAVSLDVLGDLLWATWGYNRPGKRTAPTAINLQELDLYVLKADGCWKYDAANHALVQTVAEDLRGKTVGDMARQPFVADAPITLVYVFVPERMKRPGRNFSEMDTGFLAQNAYLFCAAKGLGTVVRASFPPELAKAMQLPESNKVTLCQCIGWPAK